MVIKWLTASSICAVYMFLTGCTQPARPYVAAPSVQDFAARDRCIAVFLCKRIGEQDNPSNEELNGFAVSATAVCSQGIHEKMVEHAASYNNMQSMNDEITDEEIDTDHTEQYAFSVALDEVTSCARPTSPLE